MFMAAFRTLDFIASFSRWHHFMRYNNKLLSVDLIVIEATTNALLQLEDLHA